MTSDIHHNAFNGEFKQKHSEVCESQNALCKVCEAQVKVKNHIVVFFKITTTQ